MLHQLFHEQALRHPERTALVTDQASLSYRDLNQRSERLAWSLAELGAPRVGVCLGRGMDMVAALLGVLKSGAAWVPLDPAWPGERLEFVLQECAGPVVTTAAMLERHPGLRARPALCLDGELPAGRQPGPSPPEAYVIYTSGSTGRPKGVVGSHRAMLNRFRWMWQTFPFQSDEVGCLKTSVGFVDSVWEIFGALLQGLPLAVADDATAGDALALDAFLRRHKVTRLVAVPSLLKVLVELWEGSQTPPALRWITSSGEPLQSRLALQLLERNLRVLNLYGSSEVAADATFCELDPDHLDGAIACIGGPISGMRAWVLDENRQPVSAGQTGELYLSGEGLAEGYFQRPNLTAERFLELPEGRAFKSGDLVRQRPDGHLDYVGRVDFQIKLHGVRIEPGEIETRLRLYPGVEDCVVGAPDTPRGKRLVAWYAGPAGLDPDRLRQHLRQFLPDTMVPGAFVHLQALPLNPNGKVDRAALLLPSEDSSAPYQAPATRQEQLLVDLWQELLGVPQVGTGDHFLELGGDSILAMRVCARAQQAGLAVTPRLLLDFPRLGELAARASAQSERVEEEPEGPMPLTAMQQYYLSWATTNPHHFNNAVLFRATRPLDVGRLHLALEALVHHHDSLRLRFLRVLTRGKTFEQHYAQVLPIPIQEVNLSGLEPSAQAERIREVCAQLQSSLDIVQGPTMRLALLRGHHQGDDLLLMGMHHLNHDGTSMQFLFEDLQAAYERRPLPPRTASFGSWTRALDAYSRSPAIQAEWDYWLSIPARATRFPVEMEGQACQRDLVLLTRRVVSQSELARFRKHRGSLDHARLVNLLLASVLLSAHGFSGQRDLLLHQVGHGREACVGLDISRTCGWFVTHTPVQLCMPAQGEVSAAVAAQLAAQPHHGLGHGVLRWLSGDPRSRQLAAHDQVGLLFNYEGDLWETSYYGELLARGPDGFQLLPLPVAADNPADYLFYTVFLVVEGELLMEVFYSQRHYRPETACALADATVGHLRHLAGL